MRHPFQVSIVAPSGQGEAIVVAKRSTRERADEQAAAIRQAIGNYNRDGVPSVIVTDLRVGESPNA